MKILIAVGGSGGHLLPAQQLAGELKSEAEILFAGHRLESSTFFKQETFAFRSIAAAPLRYSFRGIWNFLKFNGQGICQSIGLIRRFRPDLVVGFGSFHSFPVLAAAWLMGCKIALFEANCLLGKVNRLFSFTARTVFAQFSLKKAPAHLKLVPLLPWKPLGDAEKRSVRVELGLDPEKPTFLVFGGSQGASFLNQAIPPVLPLHAQAIHLTGKEAFVVEVKERYEKAGMTAWVKGFEPAMHRLYAAADFAICRSGAGTAAELIRHEIPALLIPFPLAADDHQRINAEFLERHVGGAKLLVEEWAHPKALSEAISGLVQGAPGLKRALREFLKNTQGRESIAQQILQLGKRI